MSPKMSKRAKKKAAKMMREQQKIGAKGVIFSEAKQAERRARFQDDHKKSSENETKSISNRITFNTFTQSLKHFGL